MIMPDAGWSARLAIEVERSGASSVLGARVHHGPLRVQRPFYPEGPAVPHVYVLHPPGGLVGGDRLEVSVHVKERASALFTTPAAQKLYRSAGARSIQQTALDVADGGALEWLPAETIAFDGARADAMTRVRLARAAAFFGWEIVCFGRPASAQPYERGDVTLRFEIERAETPLLIERSRVPGGAPVLQAPWGYGGLPVFGTLYCVPRDPAGLTELGVELRREPLGGVDTVAVTVLDEVLVVRAAAASVEAVREVLIEAWRRLRPAAVGRAAVLPRIWAV